MPFFEKVSKDDELQRRLSRLPKQDVRSLLRFAADEGYLFSAKDYKAALETYGELSEDARERLARGLFVLPGVTLPGDNGQRQTRSKA